MKRLVATVLCMSLVLLTACQSKTNPPSQSSREESQQSSEQSSGQVPEQSSQQESRQSSEPPPQSSAGAGENTSPQQAGNSSEPAVDSAPVLYQGRELAHLYAVNTETYVMAELSDPALQEDILKGLTDRAGDSSDLNGFAYLIFSGGERQYEYLHSGEGDAALTQSCLKALADGKLHPSWFIHMTPGKIVSANGITDRAKLLGLSSFLKEEVTVASKTASHAGPENPSTVMGLFDIQIQFDSGVEYTIIGYDYFDGTGNFTVYASDLDTSVGYKLDEGIAGKITAFLKELHGDTPPDWA